MCKYMVYEVKRMSDKMIFDKSKEKLYPYKREFSHCVCMSVCVYGVCV